MSLLEWDTFEKKQVDENMTKLDDSNSGKYKKEKICNSKVYKKRSPGHLPKLYYLVF